MQDTTMTVDSGRGRWSDFLSALLSADVDIDSDADLQAYFDLHPDMYGLTERIATATRREFGPEASLFLHLYRDPEIADRYISLRVRLTAYGPGLADRFEAISQHFDQELCDASGWILINTDFNYPG
jgi:hypothetical protein